MKLKLDENLSQRAADLIRTAGHDAVTVADQGLRGAADETLFEVCRREKRKHPAKAAMGWLSGGSGAGFA